MTPTRLPIVVLLALLCSGGAADFASLLDDVEPYGYGHKTDDPHAAAAAEALQLTFYVDVSPRNGETAGSIGSGKRINITYGDDPILVGSSFCAEHGIDAARCAALQHHLREQAMALERRVATAASRGQVDTLNLHLNNATHAELPVFRGDLTRYRSRTRPFCALHKMDSQSCAQIEAMFLRHAIRAETRLAMSAVRDPVHSADLVSLVRGLLIHRDEHQRYADAKVEAHLKLQVEHRRVVSELRRENEMLRTLRDSPEWFDSERLRLIPMPRVDVRELSYGAYLRAAARGVPLIISNVSLMATRASGSHATSIPGLPDWRLDRVRQLCGNRTAVLKRAADPDDFEGNRMWARLVDAGTTSVKEYIDALEGVRPNGTLEQLYLHDAPLHQLCPELAEDVIVPPFFARDLMQRTAPGGVHFEWGHYRDYWPSLFIGGAGTSSALHADWCDSAAWMGLMQGRKHWRIGHRDDRHLLYESAEYVNRFPSTDIFLPNLTAQPAMSLARVYDGVLEPGDLLFIPAGVPHQVRNLPGEATVSVAMNYVDIAGLDRFLARIREAATAGSLWTFESQEAILRTFRSMDLERDRAQLNAALRGDDAEVERLGLPAPTAYRDFKLQHGLQS